MNYLAHARLSFQHEEILVGNMLGDFVKGKNYLQYHPNIQQGVLLHRFIDRYTDRHALVADAVKLFKPEFPLSGGIFTDILFDHFLANDLNHFEEESLLKFTENMYNILLKYQYVFDEKMKMFFSYMSKYNWLFHYRSMEGIHRSISGLCKRYPRLGDPEKALQIIHKNFDTFHKLYDDFFPDLLLNTYQEFQQGLPKLSQEPKWGS